MSKKVFETTLPIVRLAPEAGALRRWLTKLWGCLCDHYVYDEANFHPKRAIEEYLEYIADSLFFYPPDVFHTIYQRYYTACSTVSIQQPPSSKYDYIVKVMRQGKKELELSILLKLTINTADIHLSFYLPDEQKPHSAND